MVNGKQLCTVVDDCKGVAVAQAAVDCDGCQDVADEHGQAIEKLTAERAQHEAAIDLVKQELRRRADAGEDARLSAVEEVAIRLTADKVKQLGVDIERLLAVQAAVADSHTHPVFACKKHEKQLPAPH